MFRLLLSLSPLLAAFLPHVSATPMKRAVGGPVISANFPDPAVIQVGGTWYAFATTGGGVNVQMASSTDYVNWAIIKNADGSQKDALPTVPSWVPSGSPNVWAPDVIQRSDGTFVLYFSATTNQDTSKHCLGAATSSNIQGPYTPVTDGSWICPLSQGGAIDASGFKDPATGQNWIVYKIDGNSLRPGGSCGNSDPNNMAPTPILLQAVAADGFTLSGGTTQLITQSPADGPLVEAPSLGRFSDGSYILFFSSNCYDTTLYDVSYAISNNGVTGPYTKYGPLFTTGDGNGLTAPGGATIAADGEHMVFHANYGSGRAMYAIKVTASGTVVSVEN